MRDLGLCYSYENERARAVARTSAVVLHADGRFATVFHPGDEPCAREDAVPFADYQGELPAFSTTDSAAVDVLADGRLLRQSEKVVIHSGQSPSDYVLFAADPGQLLVVATSDGHQWQLGDRRCDTLTISSGLSLAFAPVPRSRLSPLAARSA